MYSLHISCHCNLLTAGYTGADCSIIEDSPPSVREMISNQTCQVRVGKCSSARFIVENFDILSSVICKLVRTPSCYIAVISNQ